ncbi:MAG: hypothetical protein ACE5GQ_07270, partial [Nitrospinales bacterium]
GIKRIVFVRMYGMTDVLKGKTDYILGLTDKLPDGYRRPIPPQVRSGVIFSSFGGYEEHPLIAEILHERIMEASRNPARETVILLAHGSGSDKMNQMWHRIIDANIERIKTKLKVPFKEIKSATLREDWPRLREKAVAEIRETIKKASQDGGKVLVISNRLYGSGPYSEYLEGLDYQMNGQGLAPHPNLTRWLEEGIQDAIENGFSSPIRKAGTSTEGNLPDRVKVAEGSGK